MDILIETTRIPSKNNKDQRGDSFITDEKKGKKNSPLEWDDFVLQEQFKYLMYIDRLLRSDPKKSNLIYELDFKAFFRLKRKTTSKFFVGVTIK